MISDLWLCLIIPAAAFCGFMIEAFLAANNR